MNTDRVSELLKSATKLAKEVLKSGDALVIIGVAHLLAEEKRREKKVFTGGVNPRPDPVQEARKTPRKPLVAETAKKKTPARKR